MPDLFIGTVILVRFVKGYNIPVKIKLELKNFRWIITNVYESP